MCVSWTARCFASNGADSRLHLASELRHNNHESIPMSQPILGSIHLDTSPARIRVGEQGIEYVSRDLPLAAHAPRMSDRLRHWASETPGALFLAERASSDTGDGDWVRRTYGEAWERAQCIAQFLLGQGLSDQRPVAILSGNSLRHATPIRFCSTWPSMPGPRRATARPVSTNSSRPTRTATACRLTC